MKRKLKIYLSIFLSVFVLVVSLPAAPAEAASVAIPYDIALEIYLHILTLIETGRISAGYQDSLFTDSYQDFLDHKQEIDDYIAAHPEQFSGVTYYSTDGSAETLDDWKSKDWVKDGNIITGGIGYKLSVFDSSDLENFNSGMNDNDFNEDNNNPFDKIKKILISAGAMIGAGGLFAGIKALVEGLNLGGASDGLNISYQNKGEWFQNAKGVSASFQRQRMTVDGWYTDYGGYTPPYNEVCYLVKERPDAGLFSLYQTPALSSVGSRQGGFWGWDILSVSDFEAGRMTADCPIFMSFDDFYNWNPANYAYNPFETGILLNGMQNNLALPLLDTNLRPYGYIAIAGALANARASLGLGSDPASNANNWAEVQPEVINDVIPIYIPDIPPKPEPDPVPPEPVPDPVPPEPDPDIDPVDPDPDPNLETIPILTGLENRFPFSIPWDLKVLFTSLQAERRAPHWEYTFHISEKWIPPAGYSYTFEIDLSQFEYLASLMRKLFLLAFVVGLAIYSFGKFFGGGD